jgi:patatin-like phospholipase/acyl hydrolase
MKRLLNIDGGGVRGYFPLLILNYIEQRTGKQILDLFDYYSGVSTSSIILSGLLTKYSVKEVITLFKNLSQSIFYRSYYYSISSIFGLINSKYPDDNMNETLKNYLKDIKLSDVKKPLSILTFDLVNSKPMWWHSYSSVFDYNLWEIVRGSTAAPTYFSPYKMDSYLLIDGGIVANNLTELIFTQAITHFGTEETFFQLSLGTGYYDTKLQQAPTGLLSWSGSMFDVLINASTLYESTQSKTLQQIKNLKSYYRLDLKLDSTINLDDYNAFDQMDIIFDKWLDDNSDYLNTICDELKKTID